MKKQFFVCALLFFAVLGAAFANGQSDGAGASDGPSKVVFWSYMGGTEGEVLQAMVDEFNGLQEKYVVELEYVPFSDMKKKYSMGLVAKELPDLGIIDNPDHAAFASMGLFEDITDRIGAWSEGNSAYFPGPWKSTILDGRNYGIPFTSNCLALFYNKEMLKKAGVDVPVTWDDLLKEGKKLSGNGTYALAISAPKTEEGTFQYLPWFLSSGGEVVKPASPECVKSLAFLRKLVTEGIMSPEVINWNQGDVEKQFASGKAAMMVNGPWNISAVQRDAPDMDWGIAMVPKDKKFASVLGGENVGIIKGGNVEGAWTFLEWMCSAENVDRYISQTGYFPPRKDVAASNKRWASDPVLSTFMEEMKFAQPRGPHPKWPQISNALSEALQKGIVGATTPEAAMKEAQAKIDEAVK